MLEDVESEYETNDYLQVRRQRIGEPAFPDTFNRSLKRITPQVRTT